MKAHHTSFGRDERKQLRLWGRMLSLFFAGWAFGAFPQPQTFAQDPIRLEKPADEPLETTLSDIVNAARTASDRLERSGLNEEVIAVQAEVITRIRYLLTGKMVPNNVHAPRSSGQQEQASQNSQGGDTHSGRGNESQSNTTPVTPKLSRSNLKDSVWGHLPPRERQDLSRTYSEQYLPGYEDRVRQYFEKLSRLRPTRNGQRSE